MWFWFGLSSAFFAAVTIILQKHLLRRISPAVLTWSLFAIPIPFLGYLSLKDGVPVFSPLFFVGAIGSGCFFVFAKMFSLDALQNSTISKMMPLTSFSTFFTYFLGLLFLSETVRPIPLIGLVSAIVGAYVLNVDQAKEGIFKPLTLLLRERNAFLFLIAMVLTSFSSVFDKIGLTHTSLSTAPMFTLFIECITMSIILLPYLERKEPRWKTSLKKNFFILAGIGLWYTFQSYFTFMAFLDGPVALVAGVKKMQILFAMILGYLFFKDKPTKHIWLGTLILLLGVILIRM